jgi:hypothetical protein
LALEGRRVFGFQGYGSGMKRKHTDVRSFRALPAAR